MDSHYFFWFLEQLCFPLHCIEFTELLPTQITNENSSNQDQWFSSILNPIFEFSRILRLSLVWVEKVERIPNLQKFMVWKWIWTFVGAWPESYRVHHCCRRVLEVFVKSKPNPHFSYVFCVLWCLYMLKELILIIRCMKTHLIWIFRKLLKNTHEHINSKMVKLWISIVNCQLIYYLNQFFMLITNM